MSTGPLTVCMAKEALRAMEMPLRTESLVVWLKNLSTENIDRVELLLKMSYNLGVADGAESIAEGATWREHDAKEPAQ